MVTAGDLCDKNQVNTLLSSGELKLYKSALAEYEKAVAEQQARIESGTREVEVKKIGFNVTNKSGMTYFVEDACGLDVASRKAVTNIAVGDIVEVSGANVPFGPLKIEKIEKIKIQKIVPSEQPITLPAPGDYFDFNMFDAMKIAEKYGGFDIPAGTHYNPTVGRVAFYCRQVAPGEERFTFVRTKDIEFLKTYYEDIGEDGWQEYRLDRCARSVVLVFQDRWEHWEVVEEVATAINVSSVSNNVATSVESDGFWNK